MDMGWALGSVVLLAAWAPATAVVAGLIVGARHAIEPDHLAAVAVLSAEGGPGRGRLRAALPGLWWGLGHALALAGVVGALLLVGAAVPPGLDAGLELLVGVMLVGLGLRGLLRARGAWVAAGQAASDGPTRPHAHGAAAHAHPGPAAHLHLGPATLAARPLVVGLVHGLAGSGALLSAAALALPDTAGRLGYVLAFGLGSTLSMGALSGLLGLPLQRALRSPRGQARAQAAAGLVSVGVGLAWGALALG
jgi:hypothetical protein